MKLGLQGNFLKLHFECLQNDAGSDEFVHVTLCLNDESTENTFAAFLVLPQPFNVGGREEFEDDLWLFTVRLSVDDDAVRGYVQIKFFLFAEFEDGGFLEPRLEEAL
jgi:hypothetical protein